MVNNYRVIVHHMEKTLEITMRNLQRYTVLRQLIEEKINGTVAAEKLNLSVRQVRQLKGRVKASGPNSLRHLSLGRSSNRQVKKKTTNRVIKLIKDHYYDCGPTFVSEKFAGHGISLSIETVRSLLIHNKLWTPRKQKKLPQYRSRRERVARAGLLEQYDGSYHRWLGKAKEEYCLLATIDDATGRITRAVLERHEGVEPTFNFWRGYINKYGCLPKRLYLDKFVESKTAKEPGREIFDEMVKGLEEEEAEGILAWHPDRLARNSVDGGRIIGSSHECMHGLR